MPPPPAQLFASRVLLGPALRAQPDRRLVDLVRDGYDTAFEEIVRRYRRQLDRFAAAIVGGRAEDVTQDAFSKALQALRKSESEIELRPWLYRIVRNTALNDLRDRGPSSEQLLESLPGSAGADADAERREELAQLMRRLHELPEAQRAALVMRELEGLSHDEIAAALGVSGGAARQAIHRARGALRDGLGLLVPMPVLRAIAEGGGEAAGVATAGGAGVAGAGLGAGAIKVGLVTVLVAGSVAGGVAIRHHEEKVGPEAATAAPTRGPEARELAETSGRAGGGGTANRGAEAREDDKGGEGREDGPGPGTSAGLGAETGFESSGSGPRRQTTDGGVSDGTEDHHGSRSGPGGGDDGGSGHSGLDDNEFDDRAGPGGGGGMQSGSGHDGSGDDSSGEGSSGSGQSTESEPESEPGSSGSGSSGSDSSGSGSGSSGSDDGGSLEPATDSGSSGPGSGDSGTSSSGSGSSDELLSTSP